MKKLDYEVLERIEGLVDLRELNSFKESIQAIVDDLEDEGFSFSEIRAYIQLELNELLGDQ